MQRLLKAIIITIVIIFSVVNIIYFYFEFELSRKLTLNVKDYYLLYLLAVNNQSLDIVLFLLHYEK